MRTSILACLFLTACAADNRGPGDVTSFDTGNNQDGVGFDGGPGFDAGPGFDGGPVFDAGPALDGGPGFDGGSGMCHGDQERCIRSTDCCDGLLCAGLKCRLPPASCGATSDLCAVDANCCPGTRCMSGGCGVCRVDRESCDADDQCCSGLCRSGHCSQPPDPATCLDLGSSRTCGDISDCCEPADSCRAHQYTQASFRCCREALSECSNSSDCCGEMACRGGLCQYADDRCAHHADCPPGFSCQDRQCRFMAGMCKDLGERCDNDCCPGLECWIDDVCEPVLGSAVCQDPGESCSSDIECCEYGICTSAGICEDFLFCGLTGASCGSDTECCSDSCVGGMCTRPVFEDVCSASGQLCGGAFGGTCCGGLSCQGGRCASAGSSCSNDGVVCRGHGDCCTGTCTDGTCGAVLSQCTDDGSACGVGAECCSGRCNGGVCGANTTGCVPEGLGCGPAAGCCGGLSCNRGTCEAPTGSCQGNSCAGSPTCCGAAPHCWSLSTGVLVLKCSAQCGPWGAGCADGDDASCCPGLSCIAGQCSDPTPCEGRACGTCCDRQPFCINERCSGNLGRRGDTCDGDTDCASDSCELGDDGFRCE